MNKENRCFLRYYQQYRHKIYNYFWYRVNFNRSLAEDMTAEAFLRVIDKFDSFDQSRPFQPWLYAIARNLLLNYYRTANREVELTQAEQVSQDFFTKVNSHIDFTRVIILVRTLPEYYQEIILLKYVDELDNQEIAQVLGKNEGAIRTQLSRALKVLKEKFD